MPEILNDHQTSFPVLRRLAMRSQSLLRHRCPSRPEPWISDGKDCGITADVNLAWSSEFDTAVGHAVIESWSHGLE